MLIYKLNAQDWFEKVDGPKQNLTIVLRLNSKFKVR